MSFEFVCESCGAVSGPSVGLCPFCKTVLTKNSADSATYNSVQKFYTEGRIDLALSAAQKFYKEKVELKSDISFMLLYVKILIETEGPNSLINSILTEAILLAPDNQEVSDYREIVQARQTLRKGFNDSGETTLKNLLRRSPDNIHALFVVGSHMHWVEESSAAAVHYLERCVKLSPNFLRAWGCLSVVYKKINNLPLCQMALQKCISLESNPTMKDFFQNELQKFSR